MDGKKRTARSYTDLQELTLAIKKTFSEWLKLDMLAPTFFKEILFIRACTLAPVLYGSAVPFSPPPKPELVQCLLSREDLPSAVVPQFVHSGAYFTSKDIANLDMLVIAAQHMIGIVGCCLTDTGDRFVNVCQSIVHWPTSDDCHSSIILYPEYASAVLKEIALMVRLGMGTSASREEFFTAAIHAFHHFAAYMKALTAYGREYKEDIKLAFIQVTGGDTTAFSESGNKAYKEGKYEEAIDRYSKAIQLHPLISSRLYSNRAQAYMRLQRPKRALADALRAYGLDPFTAKNCWRLAQALYETGSLVRAFAVNKFYTASFCKSVEVTDFQDQGMKIIDDRPAWDKFVERAMASPIYVCQEVKKVCHLLIGEHCMMQLMNEIFAVVRAHYGPEVEMELTKSLSRVMFSNGDQFNFESISPSIFMAKWLSDNTCRHTCLTASADDRADDGAAAPAAAPRSSCSAAPDRSASAAAEPQLKLGAAAAPSAADGGGGCSDSKPGSAKGSPAASDEGPGDGHTQSSGVHLASPASFEVAKSSGSKARHQGSLVRVGHFKDDCKTQKVLLDKSSELEKERGADSQQQVHRDLDGTLSDHEATIAQLSARLIELSDSAEAEKRKRAEVEAALSEQRRASKQQHQQLAAQSAELVERTAAWQASRTTLAEQQSTIARLEDDLKRTQALLQTSGASEQALKMEICELMQRYRAEVSTLEHQCHEHCMRARRAEAKLIEGRCARAMKRMIEVVKQCHLRCSGDTASTVVRGLLKAYADRVTKRLLDVSRQSVQQIRLVLKCGRLLSSMPAVDCSLPQASRDEALVLAAVMPSSSDEALVGCTQAVQGQQSQNGLGRLARLVTSLLIENPLLPPQQHEEEEEEEEEEGPEPCIICYEDMDEKQGITQLDCKHTYHTECIKGWLSKPPATCPMCRCLVQQPVPPSASAANGR